MARIRTIKPLFFRHEDLFEAEKASGLPLRVAFAGLWTAADREGRFAWKPRALKLDCLPYDECDFSSVLAELAARGFIQKYEIDGVVFGCIPSWKDHQVINNRESDSDIPAPRVVDASGTRHEPAQVEGKGREEEGKGTDSAAIAPELERSTRKKASKPLPDDYRLPENVKAKALELGLSKAEANREHEKFCNHAKQTDRRCAEWEPAEETWMIGAAERLGKEPPSSSSGAVNWPVVLELYKRTGHWSKWAGNDPSSPACQAPRDLLEKYGIVPSSSSIDAPALRTMQ